MINTRITLARKLQKYRVALICDRGVLSEVLLENKFSLRAV